MQEEAGEFVMDKLRALEELVREREEWKKAGKTVVWTNGCFDIFHAGHVKSLIEAKSYGDILVVGLNSDVSARCLKGGGRPLCGQTDRAAVLSSLEAVDRVVFFDSQRCDAELQALKPDIWVKSGDYTLDSLDPAERSAVLENGGKIKIVPLVEGLSTTALVKKIRRFDPEKIISAASTWIRDDKGRILLVKTRYPEETRWSLPGGGHRHGETLMEAALRETVEETGMPARIIRHLGVIERIEPSFDFHLNIHIFAAEQAEGTVWDVAASAAVRSTSIVDVAWFDRARLESETDIILGRQIWLKYLDQVENWPSYILMLPGEE